MSLAKATNSALPSDALLPKDTRRALPIALVEPIPAGVSEGQAVMLEVLRAAIGEAGRDKLAKGRIAHEGTAALPAHDGGFRGACFGARLILRQRDHGIHGRVHCRDPGQAGIQQFERR